MEKLHVTMPTSTACLSCHRLGESGWILCMYSFHMFFLPHLAWHHPFATLTELCLAYFGAVSNDTTLGTRFDSTPAWGKRCGSRLLRSLCQTMPSMCHRYRLNLGKCSWGSASQWNKSPVLFWNQQPVGRQLEV
jgi:hypothetical protein